MILKEYNLSVRLPQEKAIDTGISLVQNDKDVYKLNIRIFDGVNEIDYSEVDSATITFSKADGNVVQGDMTVGADSLTYTMGTNEIAHPGSVLASVQLFGAGGERLTSARFKFDVVKDLITPSAVQSTSEFPLLQRIAEDVGDIVPLIPEIEGTIQKMPEITQFFDTAEASERQRVQNETTRQIQEAARQASIADIEDRFNNLTAQQQQDAEVIDARDGETSLNARLNRDHAELTSHKADMATQLALKVNKSDIQDMRIKTFRVNASGNVTVTFSKSGFFLILINRNNTETRGIYFADTYITTVDRWTINTMSAASDIIITTGANTLNFANSSATYFADIMIVSFSGSIMT